jgi:hypothetical protein
MKLEIQQGTKHFGITFLEHGLSAFHLSCGMLRDLSGALQQNVLINYHSALEPTTPWKGIIRLLEAFLQRDPQFLI